MIGMIGLLWCVASVAAALTVTLEPKEASRFVYEPFNLLLKTSEQVERPQVPGGATWSATSIVPIQNGYRIELIANEVGTLTVPPFTVRNDKESTQTPLLRLPISAPRPAREMELLTECNPVNPVVGQPVEVTVTWKSSVPFTYCHQLELLLPLLYNSYWNVYPLSATGPEEERIGLPVNGQRIIARNAPGQLQFSYQLVPRRAGTFKFAAQLSCALVTSRPSVSRYPSYFDNHFFNPPDRNERYERVYVSASDMQLIVQPLPEEGRSVRYSGIVGNCAATAQIEPTDVVVGQPMLLTVSLTHLAFSEHIRNLPEATLQGLGPEFRIITEPMRIKTTPSAKSFTYIVRPLRSGLTVLPALAMQVFVPEEKAYRTIRTAPLSIVVNPDGEQTVYIPSRQKKPPVPLWGIRHNRKESEPIMYVFLEMLAAKGWLLWLFPPLLWLALRPWVRRRDRCRMDPAYERAVHAMRRFRKKVRRDEALAWKTYLADRFNLNAEAITYETVKPHLAHIDAELRSEVKNRFKAEETCNYAPVGTLAQHATAIHRLVKRLEKVLSVLLLLAAMLPKAGYAGSVEILFERAMEICTEKPDEAAPLFMEAALEFEVREQFLNAGNSWFFAGEKGRALANYLAALKRRPLDRKIQESIAFIRTQQEGGFYPLKSNDAASSSLTGSGQNVWVAFCQWDSALRFGALTLLYLMGWCAFLTLRIVGETVPRKMWITFGLVAAGLVFSLFQSAVQPSTGVVIQAVDAYLGPGYAYEKAVKEVIPEAVEFQWMETRNGWVRVFFPDESEAWLRETACVKVQ